MKKDGTGNKTITVDNRGGESGLEMDKTCCVRRLGVMKDLDIKFAPCLGTTSTQRGFILLCKLASSCQCSACHGGRKNVPGLPSNTAPKVIEIESPPLYNKDNFCHFFVLTGTSQN